MNEERRYLAYLHPEVSLGSHCDLSSDDSHGTKPYSYQLRLRHGEIVS